MRRLRYTDDAEDSLRAISRYIAAQTGNRTIASAFVARLRAQCRRIAELSGTLGTARPELRPDIRSTPTRNYVIFFRYDGDTVEIVNILEGHRDLDAHFAPPGEGDN